MKKPTPGQISLFDMPDASAIKGKRTVWRLMVDGASRGNPGRAGIGIVIEKNGTAYEEHGFYIGHHKTNNEAEYTALIVGLYYVRLHMQPGDHLEVRSDSELLVKQCQGVYKVRKEELIQLHRIAMTLLEPLPYDIRHLLREHTTKADELANRGVDRKKALPLKVLDTLNKYGFEL